LKAKLSLLVLVVCSLAGCRQDMHDQPRYKPYAASRLFPDGMSARLPIEGTVARGQLRENFALYLGRTANNTAAPYVTTLPIPLTKATLERGRERFNIYCSPCHSQLGDGEGMIVQRGFKHPPSYHTDRLRQEPVGYFFDVMTNGFGVMPSYASRIPVEDRWAIVAYVKALQMSQNATIEDVPVSERNNLDKPAQSAAAQAAPPKEGGH
jgi:mono/diheme cytochrome c family protein